MHYKRSFYAISQKNVGIFFDTLVCLINIGPTGINFWIFSHAYDLIWQATLINFLIYEHAYVYLAMQPQSITINLIFFLQNCLFYYQLGCKNYQIIITFYFLCYIFCNCELKSLTQHKIFVPTFINFSRISHAYDNLVG